MTFDVHADNHLGKFGPVSWQSYFEIFAVCRRCGRATTARIALRDPRSAGGFEKTGAVASKNLDLSLFFEFKGYFTADAEINPTPESLPEEIEAAFQEGSRALAISCPNAAGAMYRLCLDLATRTMLPDEADGKPDKHTRRNLAPRLRWLFENGLLPKDLRDLSSAVKDNGDEGAHAGTLSPDDASDLYDFCYRLFDRLYSEPARIAAAKARRAERHNSGAKA